MVQRFANQVAIVTGGSRGIGRAIVTRLAEEGAHVVIVDTNETEGPALVRDICDKGGSAEYICVDVTSRTDVESMVASVIERHGRINVLANNAGIHDQAAFCDEPEEMWDRLYKVNVKGVVLPSQAVVRHMKQAGGGAIVHTASKAGVTGEPGHAAYSASKGAVIAMTRSMAIELAPDHIRVNSVCPGPVMTGMLQAIFPDGAGIKDLAIANPLGRVGNPEDIAAAVAYLASSDCDWVTGQNISVDGGMSVLL